MKKIIIPLYSLLLTNCTNIETQITNKSGTIQMISTTSNNTFSKLTPPQKLTNKSIPKKSISKPETVSEIEISTITKKVIDSYVVIQ